MKNIIFGIILVLSIPANTFAITGKEVLTRVQENYEQIQSLEVNMDYLLYRGYTSKEVKENYTALFKRSGKNSYRKIAHSEYIVEDDLMICINHDDRQITLTHAVESDVVDPEIKNSLRYCSDILVLDNNGKNTSIELILKKESDLPYSRIRIDLDEDYWIEQLTFFYNTQVNFSSSYFSPQMDYPRLEVRYRDLKKNWKDETGIARLNNYVQITDDKIEATPLYKAYTIIDNRTKKL